MKTKLLFFLDIAYSVNFCIEKESPNAKDQPDHDIKYLRAGAVENTLCHGLGCIRLLGRFIHYWLHLDVEDWQMV